MRVLKRFLKIPLLYSLGFFLAGCTGIIKELAPYSSHQVIRLCVLNDSVLPVENIELLRKIVQNVSNQYESHIGVEFRISEIHSYPFVLKYTPVMDGATYGRAQSLFIRDFCSPSSDIVLIVTNIMHPDGFWAGFDWNNEDIVLLTDFELIASDSDITHARIINLLKHELGHNLGLRHVYHIDSFMQPWVGDLVFDTWNQLDIAFLMTRRRKVFGRWKDPFTN